MSLRFDVCRDGTIFRKAFLNCPSESSAPNSRAFSTNRFDCSGSSSLRFGLAMVSHLSISRSIGQPSANDTTKGAFGTIFIFDAKGRTVAVPEIILCKISVQMIFVAMRVNAFHTPLEDGEVAFDGIGVDRPAPVFALVVTDDAMAGELATKQGVIRSLIGHQMGLAIEVLAHQWGQSRRFDIINNHAARLPGLAIHQRQNLELVGIATALLLALGLLGLVVANESLVDFDNTAVAAHRSQIARPHGFADTMAHKPRGLEGNAQGPVQLVRADALLTGAEKEDRLKPDMQLDVARLEYGSDLDGKRLPAGVALVGAYPGALALELVAFVNNAAVRAYTPVGPNAGLDKLIGRFFVMEMG